MLLGPRRVGKTVLLERILAKTAEPYILLNGGNQETQRQLAIRSTQNYKLLLGNIKLLLIDEAQEIDDVGNKLKLMVDTLPGIRILATGSSAFDINQHTGEPLTGRKWSVQLYPLSLEELAPQENFTQWRDNLHHRLIYGSYPELLQYPNLNEKQWYLEELVNSYLLKDILATEMVKDAGKILNLLRLIAHQIGGEVSNHGLGNQLGISKNTVERYLYILSQIFVLYPLGGFHRNLRKEVVKRKRWYFFDNGLRNALIGNFRPIELRNDIGMLWENYMVAERLKYQSYHGISAYNYFWRTYDQQEVDWVEDRGGKLYGYEFKWNPKRQLKAPAAWRKNYPEAVFKVINRDNYRDWILPPVTEND